MEINSPGLGVVGMMTPLLIVYFRLNYFALLQAKFLLIRGFALPRVCNKFNIESFDCVKYLRVSGKFLAHGIAGLNFTSLKTLGLLTPI